jgi:hypothetical protein
MGKNQNPNVSHIVLQAPAPVTQQQPSRFSPRPPRPWTLPWAPAWFYSALNFLGRPYYDANNAEQRFGTFLVGSDVDPYAVLGSTRLFMIFLMRDMFRLTVAADTNSLAPTSGGTLYPNTDEGIRQMYLDLSASPIFASVKYCYVPGQTGSDFNSDSTEARFRSGYDPATGLRSIVFGTAVSQVVPLDDFLATHNEQIYDDNPIIVPIVTALVYDLTQYNTPGATTFVLPVYYTRDQVSTGNFYVSKFESTATVAGQTVHCGKTVTFPGGPGYVDSAATELKLDMSTELAGSDHDFITYSFDTATVYSITALSPKVEAGIMALTYVATSPASVFANQRIVGFYRDLKWTTCLGVPIYDFGPSNGSFTATATALDAPVLVYDPTHPFLNGGTLPNVIRKLAQATYLYSPDQLVSILDIAIAAKDTDRGAGLSVTTAALDFNMSSTPAASIVDHLAVPVVVTATATPPNVDQRLVTGARAAALTAVAPPHNIVATGGPALHVVGSGGNNPSPIQLAPVTLQTGMSAAVPREALDGTGITSIEIGTAFPEQNLGSESALTAADGAVVNLMHRGTPALAPYDLTLPVVGVSFQTGIYYVLSVTGTNLTVRGSDNSSATAVLATSVAPDPSHTYVGAMLYGAGISAIPLYPKLPLTLPAPAVGTHDVTQGASYSVRLTIGATSSQYDILDATQTTVDANISVPTPAPSDKSTPQSGDLYFGGFIGGASQMTVWSVPVFLTVTPAQLPAASFNGIVTLDAQASGLPDYQLQITDSSLFVYSNINVDSAAIGSLSSANAFLASAVINSAPGDTTSRAFAPCRLLMGLVRQVQMGLTLRYVFVPEDDSVVIGGTRYMVSVINLDAMDFDPNTLPYPPVFWPQSRYWQFANRHNPYIDVAYTGADQTARIRTAQTDTARIGVQTATAKEPMQMYLDTNGDVMTVWPIFAFPYATSSETVDLGQLQSITQTILGILKAQLPSTTPSGTFTAEQISVPGILLQSNPWTADTATSVAANPPLSNTITAAAPQTSITGLSVTNLSPNFVANTSIQGIAARQSLQLLQTQRQTADLAITKSLAPSFVVTQASDAVSSEANVASFAQRQYQLIYGFSVYSPGTGEAYIVEVVGTDLTIPDQLPNATQNVTYDPFYVRVVFLNTLTCYNMSIIVPSMVYDQYGHFAHETTAYQNLLSKTDELRLGYMYSLYDGAHNFDSLNFSPWPPMPSNSGASSNPPCLYTNLPYSTEQTADFSPISLFGQLSDLLFTGEFERMAERKAASFDPSLILYDPFAAPPAYFVCRRQNWSADCHLMQATQPGGKSVYLAFGAGDIVPFRLDADFTVDKRSPAHMYKLTYTFADQQYDSAKVISVANQPYFVAVTTQNFVTKYMNFSINATAGTADLQITANQPLAFPTEIYVVGQASTTLTSMADINTALKLTNGFNTTGDFLNLDAEGNTATQQFQLIPYNNLVYMIRAVSNVGPLGVIGGLGVVSGLLVDTFVPTTTGNLALAQGARYKRSGLPFFGTTYTPTTMVDTLDTLDFTSITGETFYVPTIFIPISEIDASTGFIADLSNFLGQQIWTLIYPEIVVQPGATGNGVTYTSGLNIDTQGKSILSVQKLHFAYDPIAVMFTTNDLTHKYPLQPKQQILALTNGQIQEGICWRSANVQPERNPPTNICAQSILPAGIGMDRPNIIWSPQNRPVMTSAKADYLGMSVNSFLSLAGAVFNVEESALSSELSNDQAGAGFISAVSSISTMLVGVLFDYDNNDLGTLFPYDFKESTKGVVFLNGYLGATGYVFSSPDHFDVNDVLPSQVPLLDQVASVMGLHQAFYDTDVSLPRQFWSMTYDTFTAAGLPNYITNVPPPQIDPTFSNRTRSLILSLQNPLHPDQLGLMDTYNSVVSANLHLKNGITGSILLSKKADRDVASIGTTSAGLIPLYGLLGKYDFFLFSRDHYGTLKGATFELIDQGYAMCLVDDGTGTGTKVAKYYIDTDGNYNELYSYALFSPTGAVIETASFTLKVALGAPGNANTTPVTPETPNNVNPQDLVTQINKASSLVYLAFGPSSSGQPPAFIPIQAVGSEVQAAPIMGPPGVNGYNLNVVGANRQPVQITQIYSGNQTYQIAGSTTTVPFNPRTAKPVPFYGSLSHGLDRMATTLVLRSADLTASISNGMFGGNGLGGMIGTQLSRAFQGVPAIGAIMKVDAVFYTFNAVANTVMDSTGKSATVAGGQYFIDTTDPNNPVYGVVTLPKFTLNGNTCTVNLSTTLSDGTTSRYTLVIGGHSYPFGPDNAQVTVDRTVFTFNPINLGVYTVSYNDIDAPIGTEAPAPIALTPFSIASGGQAATVDVFNNPTGLKDMILGVTGRLYSYDPVHATVTVAQGATSTVVGVQTGLTFTSSGNYGYVIGFNGAYTINGKLMYPYSAFMLGGQAEYPLMTVPQMFTLGGNFYTFDRDTAGDYLSVTGNSQTYLVNPYQFSINGVVYIINTNVQPNTVVGGGNIYTMTAGNSQFLLNGVQYTIVLKSGSLNGATISGQFNITQGNVVVIENYVYQLDTLNGQIVGNGTAYPLTTSGSTYTITKSGRSFTVTTEPNASTVTIDDIVYLINNTTVVGDGVTYPILAYRTFIDGTTQYSIGLDDTVSVAPPFTLSGNTFTDGVAYTVNAQSAFDGTNYYLISGNPTQFKVGALTYTLRTDGVAITAGAAKTYIVNTTGPLSLNQFTFGTETIFFGRAADVAAFDGTHYYAIANGQFTDSNTGLTWTISGNTAINQGNSYEIFSNLGQGGYFQVPNGPTYFVNVAVADTGTASGDFFHVFPISSGQFAIPLRYTLTVTGTAVTVNAVTFTGGATAATNLTAAGGILTGGFFTDPVTNIVYTCVVDGVNFSFVDSNNAVFPFPPPGSSNSFVANVMVSTAVPLAVDSEAPPAIYPIANSQFVVGTITYSIDVPVAYQNAAGPYWQMVNGRFIVPKAAPLSNLAYTVKGTSVTKGYVISGDDQFSADGNVVYTVNAVNVVRATNQVTISGTVPNQTLVYGTSSYALNATAGTASIQPAGVDFNTATKQFIVSYNGLPVTYTLGATSVTDSRHPTNSFPATNAVPQVTFTDTVSGITFTFNDSANNPVTAEFVYTKQFFIDVIAGVTFYIDEAVPSVEAISYLPETTQYAFVPGDGNTYLIHYNDVGVTFPVISGANVNAGIATVGSDTFTVHIDTVEPVSGAGAIPININSFEINGNLYTITGTPAGGDYLACQVVGDAITPKGFTSANTFQLTDPTITYTLQLDANNLPTGVVASFPVRTSKDLITINDDVYIITYNTVSTGSLIGQGQASIAISNSSFTLTNPFDSTKPKFIFADLNIYDAASVVGQFTVNLVPTFFMGSATYTLDTVNLVVTDNNKIPFPLIPNPTMFSVNGFNYLIDTNRVPHAIIGDNNVSPIATDVTVVSGHPIPNTTFTLGGLIYKYTEDTSGNLLAITGTKTYMINQPELTFKLDSTLIFTLSTTPPPAGSFAGTVLPIGTVTSGNLTLNLYAGIQESGGADFFVYKNVMYTLIKSAGVYEAVQKSYTVYVANPITGQQQLAVFDLSGTTYMVTDGTTAGAATPAGVNPSTMWAATAVTSFETQFGLICGFAAQPINVTQSATTNAFQFQVTDANNITTLYDIIYTKGSNANMVMVDTPNLLPTFTQSPAFNFVNSYPLTFETGGYNTYTTVNPPNVMIPSVSFAGAYRTPITSTDSQVNSLFTPQGDFSLEFWHSLPVTNPTAYHPFTYTASHSLPPLVYYVDVDFEDGSNVWLTINNTVMHAATTPPIFSSGWRHFALAYQQPYVMMCNGAGFEVKQAANYNFNRDFSVALTFSAQDVMTPQGLLYKGTGSDTTSPELSMSYRIGIANGAVTLALTDGTFAITNPPFSGLTVLQPGTFYQVIIVKQTTSPAGQKDNPDPYAPPFDLTDLGPAAKTGATASTSGFPSGSGNVTVTNIGPANPGSPSKLQDFLDKIKTSSSKSYTVTISVRTVNDDGTFGAWQTGGPATQNVQTDDGLWVNSTTTAHLLIGAAYDDIGSAMPLGSATNTGNIRDVYLFNSAINPDGIQTSTGVVAIADATTDDLSSAGIVGYWKAQYDPNGVINNPFDQNAVAVSTNAGGGPNTIGAKLAPLAGHEHEATNLYINGYLMTLNLMKWSDAPPSLAQYGPGSSLLNVNAGVYQMAEISLWQMARQQYQVIDDMFGRLVPSNEPFLAVYVSGSFAVQPIDAPILPMNKYIDNITVPNLGSSALTLSNASIDLAGCPAVGIGGPLVTPNLYTPPGMALTVCDTVPELTTYSVTLNSVTGGLAGEINEAYVYVKDNVLTLYAGKKVGDLSLTWVSQEQGNVQLIGYIEGAPPCPMANMTNKPATTFLEPTTVYVGATSVTFTTPTSVTLKYHKGDDSTGETKWSYDLKTGLEVGLNAHLAPMGFGVALKDGAVFELHVGAGISGYTSSLNGNAWNQTASEKLDESNKYTVRLQGTLAPYTGDQFMASLNTLTTPNTTAGNPTSKTAILPNPNLGGFTTSNPPAAIPKAPTEEKFGARMFVPSPYGQAFVTSQTLDVYQQTLLQTNTVYGFVRVPDTQIPRDLNIVSFRMSSKYIRPGVLDGIVTYIYNPATLPTGAQTYTTSTGQMDVLYDENFSAGEVGHDASYMRVVEAYKLKKQIDQLAYNTLALYQTAYGTQGSPTDSSLTPGLDFYNEYIWSSRGGTQEVKHTFATSFDEVYTVTTTNTTVHNINFNIKLNAVGFTIVNFKGGFTDTTKDTVRYSYNSTGSTAFDITASFDGIETDTQMRYSSNNDAHFVMNFNSMFNPNNQSGLNLVIGSDGLVYNIVPSVTSGAGLPVSDNIDTSMAYTQPQPAYTSGNADGLSGSLEAYDRPGKVKLFRTYEFFLQPSQQNADDFWNTVIDPVWLANSPDTDAAAMRSAAENVSVPWRLLHRVTYCERFLPPVSNASIIVPQITPIMAVPVTNRATDFLFQKLGTLPRPAHNPQNDIEANIVLAAPTASGISAATVPTTGPGAGSPVLPNNVIPFDLVKGVTSIVNWGDSTNAKLLSQFVTSALGINIVTMSATVPAGSTKVADIIDPVSGGTLYTIYSDPNGLTVNVPRNFGVTVYQDVNGNPIQYFDGKTYHSLQADYVATIDGSIMYYIQPPSTYDQSAFNLVGDYDLFGDPGDEWRFYLVSGMSANMSSAPSVSGSGPFLGSTGTTPYTGFDIAQAQHGTDGSVQVAGYVLVQGILQWPQINTNAETFADVQVYKSMSLLDTFPIGDPEVLTRFLKAQNPNAPFVNNDEINLVFAKNIMSYFNAQQQTLLP